MVSVDVKHHVYLHCHDTIVNRICEDEVGARGALKTGVCFWSGIHSCGNSTKPKGKALKDWVTAHQRPDCEPLSHGSCHLLLSRGLFVVSASYDHPHVVLTTNKQTTNYYSL